MLHLVPAGSALILAGIAVSQIFLPNLLAYRYMRRRRGDLLYTAHAAPEALTCTSRGVTHTLPWDRVTHLTLRGNYLEIAGGGMAAVIATRALPAGLSPDMALTACRMWAAQARRPATPPQA